MMYEKEPQRRGFFLVLILPFLKGAPRLRVEGFPPLLR